MHHRNKYTGVYYVFHSPKQWEQKGYWHNSHVPRLIVRYEVIHSTKAKRVNLINWSSRGSDTQGGIEVVHGTRGTKGGTEMWYHFFVTNTNYVWGVDTVCMLITSNIWEIIYI